MESFVGHTVHVALKLKAVVASCYARWSLLSELLSHDWQSLGLVSHTLHGMGKGVVTLVLQMMSGCQAIIKAWLGNKILTSAKQCHIFSSTTTTDEKA